MGTPKLCSLIRNVFKPDKQDDFPKTNGTKFLLKWPQLYSWLRYSPSKDGAHCLPCVLFGHRFPSKARKLRKLFSEPHRHAGHGAEGRWACMLVLFLY